MVSGSQDCTWPTQGSRPAGSWASQAWGANWVPLIWLPVRWPEQGPSSQAPGPLFWHKTRPVRNPGVHAVTCPQRDSRPLRLTASLHCLLFFLLHTQILDPNLSEWSIYSMCNVKTLVSIMIHIHIYKGRVPYSIYKNMQIRARICLPVT